LRQVEVGDLLLSIAMTLRRAGLKRFLSGESGAGASEYAVVLAVIILICTTTVHSVGRYATSTFNAVKEALALPEG
jgi:pilus assembly protein Flp/PilA